MLLHNHMGGGVLTSMHSDRKAAAHIAKAAGMRSLVLNYRRAPEEKFPAQIDDVEAAYGWLLEPRATGLRTSPAWDTRSAATSPSASRCRLRDRGAPLPGAILSISPWFDISLSSGSIESNADTDKLLSRPLLEFFRSAWLDGTGVDWNDPLVNLLAADLSGLPPIAVFYGDYELLAGEASPFALRAEAAGNDVLLCSVIEGQHSFIMGAGRVPEVDEAIKVMGTWLRRNLGLGTRRPQSESPDLETSA